MAEPPAKRAKRTDSSTMWDRNSSRATDLQHKAREKRDDRDRHYGREEWRHRSRSKDRGEKRRDRSRSRERDKNEIEMEGDTGTVVTEEMTETRRTESEVQAEKDTDHGEVYESSAHHSYLFTSTLNANLSSSRRPPVETSSFSLSLTKPL